MKKKLKPGLGYFKDRRGEWRWRVVQPNGRITGVSSESYKNRLDCVAGQRATRAVLIAEGA